MANTRKTLARVPDGKGGLRQVTLAEAERIIGIGLGLQPGQIGGNSRLDHRRRQVRRLQDPLGRQIHRLLDGLHQLQPRAEDRPRLSHERPGRKLPPREGRRRGGHGVQCGIPLAYRPHAEVILPLAHIAQST